MMQQMSFTAIPNEICSIIFCHLPLRDLSNMERVCKKFCTTIQQFNYLAAYLNMFEYFTQHKYFCSKAAEQANAEYCTKNNVIFNGILEHVEKKYHRLSLVISTICIPQIILPRNAKQACKMLYLLHVKMWASPSKELQIVQKMPELPFDIVEMHAYHCLVAVRDTQHVVHIGDISSCEWLCNIKVEHCNKIFLSHAIADYKLLAKQFKSSKYQCVRLYVACKDKLQLYQIVEQVVCAVSLKQEWMLPNITQVVCCNNLTFSTDNQNHLFVLSDSADITCIGSIFADAVKNFPTILISTTLMHDMTVNDITKYHVQSLSSENTILIISSASCYNSHSSASFVLLQVELDKQNHVVAVSDLLFNTCSYSSESTLKVSVSPSGAHWAAHCRCHSYGCSYFVQPVFSNVDYDVDEMRETNCVVFYETTIMLKFHHTIAWYNAETHQSKDLTFSMPDTTLLCVARIAGIPLIANKKQVFISVS